MQRRKLLAEKILDGEVKLLADSLFEGAVNAALAAERFVFDSEFIEDAYDTFSGRPHAEWIDLAVPPYSAMWIETQHHNQAFVVFRGTYEHLSKLFAPGGVKSAPPQNYSDDYLGVCAILGAIGCDESTRQIMPAMTLRSVKCNEATGGVPRGVLIHEEHLLDDAEIEMMFSFAEIVVPTLALLNVRGATESSVLEVDPKIAKARAKRGKPPLRNYTYIVSTIRDRESGAGGDASKAAHLVRGRFKRRKTGTFWWRPHVAGSGELQKRDAYIVKP